MRSDVAADLEHDLRVRCQPNPPGVAETLAAVHERPHRRRGAERGDATRPECLPPDPKDDSERRAPRRDPDHARRRGRVHGIHAAGRTNVRPQPAKRRSHADPGRNRDHAPVREQLQMDAEERPVATAAVRFPRAAPRESPAALQVADSADRSRWAMGPRTAAGVRDASARAITFAELLALRRSRRHRSPRSARP